MILCGTKKYNQAISFQIFVKFSTRVMTNKNEEHVIHLLIYVGQKQNKEDDHLFQNVCANWISAYFHFPQVC